MKSKFYLFVMLIAIFSLMINCNQKIDFESEKDAIRRDYDITKYALLNSDVDTLLSLYPDDYKGYSISRGNINEDTKETLKEVLESQSENVKFTLIENLREPIIGISPDGKMGWTIGERRFVYSTMDSVGNKQTFDIIGTHLSVYEKKNEKWVEIASSPSSKPYKSE